MDPKRQREIALAIAAILLVAVAVWTMRREHGASPRQRRQAALLASNVAADVEASDRRDRSRGPRGQAVGARGERQKSISIQAEAGTAAAAGGRQATTGTGRRRCSGSGRAVRATAAAADSAEVHRRDGRSEEDGTPRGNPERRLAACTTAARARSSKGAIGS